MRGLLIALIIAGFCMAVSVQPTFIDVKDTGSRNLPTMNVGITIDCDTKALTATVTSNYTGEPVKRAETFLFYTNYAYQAISTNITGADGVSYMSVVGNRDYLTSLFILHVEQGGFRTREIEFTYEKCASTQPPVPPPNVTNRTTENQTNSTNQQQNKTLPVDNTSLVNVTPPAPVNQTHTPPPSPHPSSSLPCLPSLLLIPAALLAMRG